MTETNKVDTPDTANTPVPGGESEPERYLLLQFEISEDQERISVLPVAEGLDFLAVDEDGDVNVKTLGEFLVELGQGMMEQDQ